MGGTGNALKGSPRCVWRRARKGGSKFGEEDISTTTRTGGTESLLQQVDVTGEKKTCQGIPGVRRLGLGGALPKRKKRKRRVAQGEKTLEYKRKREKGDGEKVGRSRGTKKEEDEDEIYLAT